MAIFGLSTSGVFGGFAAGIGPLAGGLIGNQLGGSPQEEAIDERKIREDARAASFGRMNAGTLPPGKSREQLENEIFHGILNEQRQAQDAARVKREEEERARQARLAEIRGAREGQIAEATKQPGILRSQTFLTERPVTAPTTNRFLTGRTS